MRDVNAFWVYGFRIRWCHIHTIFTRHIRIVHKRNFFFFFYQISSKTNILSTRKHLNSLSYSNGTVQLAYHKYQSWNQLRCLRENCFERGDFTRYSIYRRDTHDYYYRQIPSPLSRKKKKIPKDHKRMTYSIILMSRKILPTYDTT